MTDIPYDELREAFTRLQTKDPDYRRRYRDRDLICRYGPLLVEYVEANEACEETDIWDELIAATEHYSVVRSRLIEAAQ